VPSVGKGLKKAYNMRESAKENAKKDQDKAEIMTTKVTKMS
jgi:hypothetical protein